MKLIQKYPLNWYSQYTYEITDSTVTQSYRSLWGAWQRPLPLKDISPLVGQTTSGNKSRDNLAWTAWGIAAVLFFWHLFRSTQIALVLFGVICFAIRLLVRDTFTVCSSAISHEPLFSIKRTKAADEARFIEELKKRTSST